MPTATKSRHLGAMLPAPLHWPPAFARQKIITPASDPKSTEQPLIESVPPDSASTPKSIWKRRLQLGAVAGLVLGYAALSQYGASSASGKGLGAAMSVAPILLIAVFLIWRWTRPLTALLAAALCVGVLWSCWPAIEQNYEWADLAQQCGVYGLIALGFARSLFGGRVPLCTQLAIKLHGALTPIEIAYNRGATLAWAVFYGALTAAVLVLFFFAPMRVWSLFVNFGVLALIVLAGILDHAMRRRVLPRHPSGRILSIIRRSLIG